MSWSHRCHCRDHACTFCLCAWASCWISQASRSLWTTAHNYSAHMALHRLRCMLFPAKDVFGVLSFSYFLLSMVLCVLCVPPCFSQSMQCFASMHTSSASSHWKRPSISWRSSLPSCLRESLGVLSQLWRTFWCAQVLQVTCKHSGVP